MRTANTAFAARSIAAAKATRDSSNHYKGAQVGSPRRAYVPAYYRDARFDANSFSRSEMARKIRDFERNVWIIGRLKSIYSQYSVGPNGLSVSPASSDAEYNKRQLEHYEAWCQCPARDSALPMGEQHQLMADTTHIDGGLFINFCSRKPGRGQSIPAIQLIEGHRVATPGSSWSDSIGGIGNNRTNVVDGVQIDDSGRPVGYWIRDSFDGDNYVFRQAYDPLRPQSGGVMHVFDPDRIGQYREITPYHAVLNQVQDLDMLATLEMDRAKENASVAYQIGTIDGELPDAQNLVRKTYNQTTANGSASDPNEDLQKRIQQYATQLGSKVVATRIGEEMKQFGSESPSACTQWYWRFLIEQVSENVNIPVILVLPESVQGTVARGVLDDAQTWFTDRFHTFKRPALAAFRHWATWAAYNIPDLADPPADYLQAHVTPPRAVNVDVGYNAAAELASYGAGFTNLDDIAGKNGKTARELITKKARGVGLIKQIAAQVSKEMGVEVSASEISAPIADIAKNLAIAEQAKGIGAQGQAIAEATEEKSNNP